MDIITNKIFESFIDSFNRINFRSFLSFIKEFNETFQMVFIIILEKNDDILY
jgi:hypothetical protein